MQVAATESTEPPDRNFRFGPFELIEREGELRKNGVRVKLQEQPFRVLVELVANAGKVVSREGLQQKLWSEDTFVDFDTGLNTAIRKLRAALNDDADEPRYIETLARRGYRFIAPVGVSASLETAELVQTQLLGPMQANAVAADNPTDAAISTEEPEAASAIASQVATPTGSVEDAAPASNVRGAKWKWLAAGACAAALVVGVGFWWMRPPEAAVVESITQITDDGQPKGTYNSLQSDGSRLYFNEGRRGDLQIAQVAVTGGTVSIIPTPVLEAQPGGVAPDGSFLAVLQGGAAPPGQPIWKVPLPSGDPIRLGNYIGQDVSVTPDKRIMVSYESQLTILDADGSNPRTPISGIDAWVGNPTMSPDGRQIAFSYYSHKGGVSIYLANSDGSGLHEIATNPKEGFCCPAWTADSRYLLFETRGTVMQNIWYLPMRRSWWQRRVEPRKLTALPLSLHDSTPNPRDGKTVFALGTKERGELVRYDMKTKQFAPFMGGISATDMVFSPDGKWVAYNSFPDLTLWRSRADGSDRMQLSHFMVGEEKRFSPDGKDVVFNPLDQDMALVSLEGGAPKSISGEGRTHFIDWSPDGRRIVFAVRGLTQSGIYLLDPASGERDFLSKWEGFWGARWIGDDKLVAALQSRSGFKLFDQKNRIWSDWLIEPSPNTISRWGVSPDHQYLYYATSGSDPQLMRVRIGENRAEPVASLKDFNFAMFVQFNGGDEWISFAPDGSPLLTRDKGSQEIYALTVRWP